MNGSDIPVITLVVVSFLTWLVFVITACKFYKFFSVFENYKSKNDVELNSLVWHAKKLDGSLTEIIAELRRANKLLYEIDMGRSSQPEPVPESEQDFNTEDILRHKKMDLNKTPSPWPVDYSQTGMDNPVLHNADHMPASHATGTKLENLNAAHSSHSPEHKTAPDVASLQQCLDDLAKSAIQGVTPTPAQGPAHGSRSTQPVSERQAHAHSEHSAHHNHHTGQHDHSSEQLNPGTLHLKKTPAGVDTGHLQPPPDDLSSKLSIDALSSKVGQLDLKHLTESPNAVFVKADKSHSQS
jgi:hypothetical protein